MKNNPIDNDKIYNLIISEYTSAYDKAYKQVNEQINIKNDIEDYIKNITKQITKDYNDQSYDIIANDILNHSRDEFNKNYSIDKKFIQNDSKNGKR